MKLSRRFSIALILLVIAAWSAAAQDSGQTDYGFQLLEDRPIKTINIDTNDLTGKAKAGLALGYPTAITFGLHLSNATELNLFAGSNFSFFSVGTSFLFTLAQLDIDGEVFPLSAGPALFLHFTNPLDFSVLGTLRMEYSFTDVPLNLYLEGGPGVSFLPAPQFRWTASLGLRYIF